MDFNQSVQEFQSFLPRIESSNLVNFLGWIKNNIDDFIDKANDMSGSENEIILNSIREDLRESLPQNCLSPTENIITPSIGKNNDCDPATTVHVDAFLYDDDAVDELCDEGKMSRNYCVNCGSHNVKPLTFITHSSSVPQIKYMFQHLLPDLRGKTVVDIGSRTGAILYGAYLFSSAEEIKGVEIDRNFCQLQQHTIEKYNMMNRIQIINNDVLNCAQLLQTGDVIILNNVFEFFMPRNTQERIWNFLYNMIQKSGSLLVTVPSIEEALQNLQTEVNLTKWVNRVDSSELLKQANMVLHGSEGYEDSDLGNVNVYIVK